MSVRLACYVFVLGCTFEFINKKTWPEAQKTCRQMNMDLVSIHSERENSFIYNMIKNKSQIIWIGLKRQPGGTLNGFGWSDNSLANFAMWNSGEPNNHLEKENCGEMYYWNGHWNDFHCEIKPTDNSEIKKGFICKAQTYGPSNISLSGPLVKHLSPQQSVNISCTAYDVFPGVQYSWSGISCVQRELLTQDSTCTFTPSKSDDGKTVTCTAKNVKNISLLRTASYRISIADGPSNVSISEPLFTHLRPNQTVNLSCFAYDAFPGVSYTWSGITCDQVKLLINGSTCSFTPSTSDDGKTVMCTARNLRDINLTRTATYKINIAGDTPSGFLLIISGSIGAFVVLTLALTVVVLWKKRHRDNNICDAQGPRNKRVDGYSTHHAPKINEKIIYKGEDADRQGLDNSYYANIKSVAICPLNAEMVEGIQNSPTDCDYEEIVEKTTSMTEITVNEPIYSNT